MTVLPFCLGTKLGQGGVHAAFCPISPSAQNEADFTNLIRRVCSGSRPAAQELVERHGPLVHRVARRKLIPALRDTLPRHAEALAAMSRTPAEIAMARECA